MLEELKELKAMIEELRRPKCEGRLWDVPSPHPPGAYLRLVSRCPLIAFVGVSKLSLEKTRVEVIEVMKDLTALVCLHDSEYVTVYLGREKRQPVWKSRGGSCFVLQLKEGDVLELEFSKPVQETRINVVPL